MDHKETIAEGRFLRFINDNGWEYVERTNCTATVAIIAATQENEILFTEQYRWPLAKKTIELPAGLVNDKVDTNSKDKNEIQETIEEAAKRELLEETGYSAEEIIYINDGPSSSGLTSETQTLMMAKGLKKLSEGGGDASEDIIVHKIPLNKVEGWLHEMQKRGYLIDTKIYAGLYFIKNLN